MLKWMLYLLSLLGIGKVTPPEEEDRPVPELLPEGENMPVEQEDSPAFPDQPEPQPAVQRSPEVPSGVQPTTPPDVEEPPPPDQPVESQPEPPPDVQRPPEASDPWPRDQQDAVEPPAAPEPAPELPPGPAGIEDPPPLAVPEQVKTKPSAVPPEPETPRAEEWPRVPWEEVEQLASVPDPRHAAGTYPESAGGVDSQRQAQEFLDWREDWPEMPPPLEWRKDKVPTVANLPPAPPMDWTQPSGYMPVEDSLRRLSRPEPQEGPQAAPEEQQAAEHPKLPPEPSVPASTTEARSEPVEEPPPVEPVDQPESQPAFQRPSEMPSGARPPTPPDVQEPPPSVAGRREADDNPVQADVPARQAGQSEPPVPYSTPRPRPELPEELREGLSGLMEDPPDFSKPVAPSQPAEPQPVQPQPVEPQPVQPEVRRPPVAPESEPRPRPEAVPPQPTPEPALPPAGASPTIPAPKQEKKTPSRPVDTPESPPVPTTEANPPVPTTEPAEMPAEEAPKTPPPASFRDMGPGSIPDAVTPWESPDAPEVPPAPEPSVDVEEVDDIRPPADAPEPPPQAVAAQPPVAADAPEPPPQAVAAQPPVAADEPPAGGLFTGGFMAPKQREIDERKRKRAADLAERERKVGVQARKFHNKPPLEPGQPAIPELASDEERERRRVDNARRYHNKLPLKRPPAVAEQPEAPAVAEAPEIPEPPVAADAPEPPPQAVAAQPPVAADAPEPPPQAVAAQPPEPVEAPPAEGARPRVPPGVAAGDAGAAAPGAAGEAAPEVAAGEAAPEVAAGENTAKLDEILALLAAMDGKLDQLVRAKDGKQELAAATRPRIASDTPGMSENNTALILKGIQRILSMLNEGITAAYGE